MNVNVNGRVVTFPEGVRLADVLLRYAGEQTRGVAAAVNGEVVPKRAWSETQIGEGDRVEVLRAVGGG